MSDNHSMLYLNVSTNFFNFDLSSSITRVISTKLHMHICTCFTLYNLTNTMSCNIIKHAYLTLHTNCTGTRKLKLIYITVYNYIQTIEKITNVLVPYKEVKTYL